MVLEHRYIIRFVNILTQTTSERFYFMTFYYITLKTDRSGAGGM